MCQALHQALSVHYCIYCAPERHKLLSLIILETLRSLRALPLSHQRSLVIMAGFCLVWCLPTWQYSSGQVGGTLYILSHRMRHSLKSRAQHTERARRKPSADKQENGLAQGVQGRNLFWWHPSLGGVSHLPSLGVSFPLCKMTQLGLLQGALCSKIPSLRVLICNHLPGLHWPTSCLPACKGSERATLSLAPGTILHWFTMGPASTAGKSIVVSE